MELEISTTNRDGNLAKVLSQVRERGNRFVVCEKSEKFATIAPVPTARGATWSELTARVPKLAFPEGGFADELEAVQASQVIAKMPE